MKHALDTLIDEALGYEADAFDLDELVNGSDLVDWFSNWRQRLQAARAIQSRASEEPSCHRR